MHPTKLTKEVLEKLPPAAAGQFERLRDEHRFTGGYTIVKGWRIGPQGQSCDG